MLNEWSDREGDDRRPSPSSKLRHFGVAAVAFSVGVILLYSIWLRLAQIL